MRKQRLAKRRIAALVLSAVVASYFLASAGFAVLNYSDYGAAPPQFLRYIAFPVLAAVLVMLLALFLKPQPALLVGIYAVSLLFSLFAVEAYLTYGMLKVRLAMLGQISNAERQAGGEDLLRGFTLNRLNGLTGTEQLASSILSGIPGTDVVLCTPEGRIVGYSADRLGFANDNSVYGRKAEVLVVGDSFIEGFCLEPKFSLVSQLRGRGLNAVGMGIRGNGPLLELATIGRYGPLLEPPTVVMAFFEANDWENLENELARPWLAEALHQNADFGAPNGSEADLVSAREMLQRISASTTTVSDVIERTSMVRNFFALHLTGASLGLIYPKAHGDIPQYRDVLTRAKQLTESWGGRFALLYIPQTDRFHGVMPTDFVFDQLRSKVLKAADDAGVEVLDLVPVFHDQSNPARFYAADGHFSREGAQFTANWLADQLRPYVEVREKHLSISAGQKEASRRTP